MADKMARMARRAGGALLITMCLASTAPARADDAVPLDEYRALMVGKHRLKLGILNFEYGITRDVSVGIDTPAYVAAAVTPVLAPNVHVKWAFYNRPSVAVAVLVPFYYLHATSSKVGPADGVVVPISLFGSWSPVYRLWLHGELAYLWVRATASGEVAKGNVGGSVATRAGQIGLAADYHFTRVFAVTARARYQAFVNPLQVRANGTLDDFTTFHLGAEVRPEQEHAAMAVAGVAFTWSHVGLTLSAGYGNYFIPGINIALPTKSFVPDGSIWVSF